MLIDAIVSLSAAVTSIVLSLMVELPPLIPTPIALAPLTVISLLVTVMSVLGVPP